MKPAYYEIDRLRAELAAKDARIATLEGLVSQGITSERAVRTENETLRAGLAAAQNAERDLGQTHGIAMGVYADRVDDYEAELASAYQERDNMASLNSSLIAQLAEARADAETRREALENATNRMEQAQIERKRAEAERDAMRELLQIVWNGFTADVDDAPLTTEQIQRVRAALAPPPAGDQIQSDVAHPWKPA